MSTLCIPEALGVPGLSGEPPKWFTNGFPGSVNTDLNDPRWRGALSHTYGMGTESEADFRALYKVNSGQTALFLSWRVKYDPEADNNQDGIYVGFVPSGADPLIIRINAYSSSGSDITAGSVSGGIQALTRNSDGTVTPLSDEPNWINLNTRAWLTVSPLTWAIQMLVPFHATDTDLGVNLGNDFKMWYSIQTYTPGGIVAYNFPRASDIVTVGLDDIFPDPATEWQDYHLSTGASDPVCPTTGGISLQYLDVGTTNTPSSAIEYDGSVPVGSRPVNTFYARPRNNSGSTVPAGGISANFRIANWGSVADPTAPWDTIPGGGSVASTADIPDGTQAGTSNISFNWKLDDTDIANFIAGKTKHQCMLVTLEGGGLTFLNKSVYRNMDFVSASAFNREAEISVVGLEPLSDGRTDRDTYLGVETLNMPAIIPQKPSEPQKPTEGEPPVIIKATHETLSRMREKGAMTTEQLDKAFPTYRVHVYYDTGKRLKSNGKEHAILRPQSSFGYYVIHEGELYGWDHTLAGAQKIAPDFYKLAVPDNGVAKVSTQIVSVEQQGYWLLRLLRLLLERLPWWGWLIIIVIIVLLFVFGVL